MLIEYLTYMIETIIDTNILYVFVLPLILAFLMMLRKNLLFNIMLFIPILLVTPYVIDTIEEPFLTVSYLEVVEQDPLNPGTTYYTYSDRWYQVPDWMVALHLLTVYIISLHQIVRSAISTYISKT